MTERRPKTRVERGGGKKARDEVLVDSIVKAVRKAEAEQRASSGPDHSFFVKQLTEEFTFATMVDTEEVYLYDNGRYRPGAEGWIRGAVEQHYRELNESARHNLVNEVIYGVRRRTYVARAEFNPVGKVCLVNGVLDLASFMVTPHTINDRFTVQLPVTYDPKAEAPRFVKFMEEVLPDEDARRIAQMRAGYCLRPGNWLQRIFMDVGGGNNGKTTFFNVLRDLFGPENTSSESLQRLAENRFAAANLWGKLVNLCADVPTKPIRYTGIIKQLTGGDPVPGEFKGKGAFFFPNQAKLFFACNELPEVSDRTFAWWRRWIVTEWFVDLTGREDRFLPQKLHAELPGIFNWALEGLRMLEKEGDFPKTASTDRVKENWQRRADSLLWFIQEDVQIEATAAISKDEFYESYAEFCSDKIVTVKTPEQVGTDIRRLIPSVRQERPHRESGTRYWTWRGISWNEPHFERIEARGMPVGKHPDRLDHPDRDAQQTRLDGKGSEAVGQGGQGGQGGGLPAATLESGAPKPVGDQNPDRMFAYESARNQARIHPTIGVAFARGDALKEYRLKFNRDPDRDQFEAGIIGGLKAAKDARDAGGSP